MPNLSQESPGQAQQQAAAKAAGKEAKVKEGATEGIVARSFASHQVACNANMQEMLYDMQTATVAQVRQRHTSVTQLERGVAVGCLARSKPSLAASEQQQLLQ